MSTKHQKTIGAVAVAVLLAVFLAACGGDDLDDGGSETAAAEHTDGAFIAEMMPHHEAAIEMAEIATGSAEHPELKQLANENIAVQGEEIAQLEPPTSGSSARSSGTSITERSASPRPTPVWRTPPAPWRTPARSIRSSST